MKKIKKKIKTQGHGCLGVVVGPPPLDAPEINGEWPSHF
jgi:hypothetical protein